MVEQPPFKRLAAGSNPAILTFLCTLEKSFGLYCFELSISPFFSFFVSPGLFCSALFLLCKPKGQGASLPKPKGGEDGITKCGVSLFFAKQKKPKGRGGRDHKVWSLFCSALFLLCKPKGQGASLPKGGEDGITKCGVFFALPCFCFANPKGREPPSQRQGRTGSQSKAKEYSR